MHKKGEENWNFPLMVKACGSIWISDFSLDLNAIEAKSIYICHLVRFNKIIYIIAKKIYISKNEIQIGRINQIKNMVFQTLECLTPFVILILLVYCDSEIFINSSFYFTIHCMHSYNCSLMYNVHILLMNVTQRYDNTLYYTNMHTWKYF